MFKNDPKKQFDASRDAKDCPLKHQKLRKENSRIIHTEVHYIIILFPKKHTNINSLTEENEKMPTLLRLIVIALLMLPSLSKNLRRKDINSTQDKFSHIDDSFLENTFDEMETMLHENEYRIALVEASQGMLSDMLLEEVNLMEKKLIYGHIDCAKAKI